MLNRELGLIEFYNRVMFQAKDPQVPILERLRYLGIVSRNCDEFFEVRVARLLNIYRKNPLSLLPCSSQVKDILTNIRINIAKLNEDICKVYYDQVLPELALNKVEILNHHSLNNNQQYWLKDYFINNIKSSLKVINIDENISSLRVANKSLYFALQTQNLRDSNNEYKMVLVEVDANLPKIINIPSDLNTNQNHSFILLQDIIKLNITQLLDSEIIDFYTFKITRASDFNLSFDGTDLRLAIAKKLYSRKYAPCARLEIDIKDKIPNNDFIYKLLEIFNLKQEDLYLINGPVDLARLVEIADSLNYPKLKFPLYIPGLPLGWKNSKDIFSVLNERDILIHTPYQSFDPVLQLVKEASQDDKVIAIKVTIYRAGADSDMVQYLIKAARAQKQVVVSIELFARFDEEVNVELANSLERAGVQVVYGVMGYKVHAKMLLVIRKDGENIKKYAHIGTGNYNKVSSQIYTDFGLLTTRENIVNDIDNIFAQIIGIGKVGALKKIATAPLNLHTLIINNIKRETGFARQGKDSKIIAKMNSLLEPNVIECLYEASKAGVEIQLIVRGACALIPGIPGLSENIVVKSIVGRFLEHHRIFYFYNLGEEELYISSADWMKRNFYRRVETCLPILQPEIKHRIIEEGLKVYLKDNVKSWVMNRDGSYTKLQAQDEQVSAQDILMRKLGNVI